MMRDSELLRAIAIRMDEHEDLRAYCADLEAEIRGLRRENDYLNDLLQSIGFLGDPNKLSVGQTMNIHEALRNIT